MTFNPGTVRVPRCPRRGLHFFKYTSRSRSAGGEQAERIQTFAVMVQENKRVREELEDQLAGKDKVSGRTVREGQARRHSFVA